MASSKSNWRFFVECAACGEPIILGDAPSPEENERLTHQGVEIDCPHCGARHTYRGAEVQRGQLEDEDE